MPVAADGDTGERSHRRYTSRAFCWPPRRSDRHENTDRQANADRNRLDHQIALRQFAAQGVKHPAEQLGQSNAGQDPDDRRCESDKERLAQDHRPDFSVGHTKGPQQRQISRSLSDEDRKGHVDDERRHDQRNSSEDIQQDSEEFEGSKGPVGVSLRNLS